jgi:hypothetical protein
MRTGEQKQKLPKQKGVEILEKMQDDSLMEKKGPLLM